MVIGSDFAVALPSDGDGDQFALQDQALLARLNEAGPELGEIEDAEHEGEEARDVQKNNSARQAGKALGDEELPAVSQRSGKAFLAQDIEDADEESNQPQQQTAAPPSQNDWHGEMPWSPTPPRRAGESCVPARQGL